MKYIKYAKETFFQHILRKVDIFYLKSDGGFVNLYHTGKTGDHSISELVVNVDAISKGKEKAETFNLSS